MILRKPYRFLIKNFRLIHIILAIISGYLLIRTNNILSFFNNYLNTSETIITSGTSSEYFNSLMTFLIVISIIGTAVILIILKMKDKPVIFYIITEILFIAMTIIYAFDNSVIQRLELSVLDIRTIKLASDFTLICFLIQTLSTIILTFRAIGFNIKKFNFDEDLKLEINEKDNEEFEFNLDVDKNKLKRNIKKNIRNLKYTYQENKFIYNIIIIVLAIITTILIVLNITVFNKVYRKNQTINTTDYTYSLVNSYLIDKDYRNNKITNNYLVVTKLKIKTKYLNKKMPLETARLQLHIGKTTYNPIITYKDSLIDLGINYTNEELTNEYTEYLVVFEIPRSYSSKKMYLRYNDTNNKKYNIKLKNIKFDKEEVKITTNLNEFIVLNNKIVKDIKFRISNYEINNKIKALYTFCETKNKCYESYEYVYPTLTDNYDKVILKINSEFELNNQNIPYFNDLSDFIENYAKIKYTINNETKEMTTKIKEIKPSKSNIEGTYYFEIYKEIKDADQISLIFTIRNKEYEYILK